MRIAVANYTNTKELKPTMANMDSYPFDPWASFVFRLFCDEDICMTLDKIFAPIAEELQRVENQIKNYLNSDNKFVHQLNADQRQLFLPVNVQIIPNLAQLGKKLYGTN